MGRCSTIMITSITNLFSLLTLFRILYNPSKKFKLGSDSKTIRLPKPILYYSWIIAQYLAFDQSEGRGGTAVSKDKALSITFTLAYNIAEQWLLTYILKYSQSYTLTTVHPQMNNILRVYNLIKIKFSYTNPKMFKNYSHIDDPSRLLYSLDLCNWFVNLKAIHCAFA